VHLGDLVGQAIPFRIRITVGEALSLHASPRSPFLKDRKHFRSCPDELGQPVGPRVMAAGLRQGSPPLKRSIAALAATRGKPRSWKYSGISIVFGLWRGQARPISPAIDKTGFDKAVGQSDGLRRRPKKSRPIWKHESTCRASCFFGRNPALPRPQAPFVLAFGRPSRTA